MKNIKIGDSLITKYESNNVLKNTFNIELYSPERNTKTYAFDVSITDLENLINTLKNYKPTNNNTII